jgi:hypothetical protein
VWGTIKDFGKNLWSSFTGMIKDFIQGIGKLGAALWKLLKGDFKGAWEDCKTGVTKLFASSPFVAGVKLVVTESKTIGSAYKNAAVKAPKIKKKETVDNEATMLDYQLPAESAGNINGSAANSKNSKVHAIKLKPVILSDDINKQLADVKIKSPSIKIIDDRDAPKAQAYTDAIDEMGKSIGDAEKLSVAFGDSHYLLQSKIDATRQAIEKVIKNGFNPQDKAIQKLIGDYKQLSNQQQKESAEENKAQELQQKRLQVIGKDWKEWAKNIGNNLSKIGRSVKGVAGEWMDFFGNVLQAIPDLIGQFSMLTAEIAKNSGQQTAAAASNVAANASETASNESKAISGATASSSGIPFPYNIIAIAVSIAAVLAALATSVPKMASGGIVSGPTNVLVGEYAGAGSNPEVIAPLNKLKGMLQPTGGYGGGTVVFKIQGRTLRGVLQRDNQYRDRTV